MGSRLGVKWESSWSRMGGRIPLLVDCQLQIVMWVVKCMGQGRKQDMEVEFTVELWQLNWMWNEGKSGNKNEWTVEWDGTKCTTQDFISLARQTLSLAREIRILCHHFHTVF